MFFKKDTGKQLRKLMAEYDVNTSELADGANVSAVTVSGLRTGRIEHPQRDTMKKIARFFSNKAGYKVHPKDIFPHMNF